MNDLRISQHPILVFPRKTKISFYFHDQEIWVCEREPFVAALHASRIKFSC